MKKILAAALLWAMTGNVLAQNTLLPTYEPPSPDAASLGKYVEHPVGNFTGTPEVKIPLFEIKTGRITLPISISYHGSGVKLDEVASRVGIGWSLNAGGVVTRVIKQGFDEGFGLSFDQSYFNAGFIQDLGNNNYERLANDDKEPDPHYYNFNNKKGIIYFKDRTHPYAMNMDPMKIDGPYNGSDRFIITTEEGLIYTFEDLEEIHLTYAGSSTTTIVPSSWFLTNIQDPVTGKNIHFQYRSDVPDHLTYDFNVYTSESSCIESNLPVASIHHIWNPKILQKITYDGGYIEFKADLSRNDLSGDKAYTEINEYTTFFNGSALKKGYTLTYTNNDVSKRLFLESLQEKGSIGTFLPPYLFYYKNKDLLPERESLQQDIWGYYNANGLNYTVNNAATYGVSLYPKVYINPSAGTYLPFDADPGSGIQATQTVSGVDRAPNSSTVDYGVLNKVVYPTQGYTTYTYEIHHFDNDFSGGGIRIKEISDYSRTGAILSTQKYDYQLGFLGGAYPRVAYMLNGTLVRFSASRSVLGSSQGSNVGYVKVGVTKTGPSGNNNGKVVYQYSADHDVAGTFTNAMGTFACATQSQVNSLYSNFGFPYFEMESREQRRGILQQEDYYDTNGNSIKTITYNYDLLSSNITSLVSCFISMDRHSQPSPFVNGALVGSRNLNAEKMLLTLRTETLNSGNINLNNIQPIITKATSYTYTDGVHNGQFLRSMTEYDGNANQDPNYNDNIHFLSGRSTQTNYKYPFDYASSASNGVMGYMMAMNYISPIISEIKTRTPNAANNNPVSYYTDVKINDYKINPLYASFSHVCVVPSQIFRSNFSGQISQGTPGSNTSIEVADPANPGGFFDKRIEFSRYDMYSNPTLIKRDGQYEGLLWSDNGLLMSKTASSNVNAVSSSLPPQSWQETFDTNAKTGVSDWVWDGYDTPSIYTMDGVNPTTVSFWAKEGTVTVADYYAGLYSQTITAPSDWTYYTFTIPGQGDFLYDPISITGTATLDDIMFTNDNGLTTKYGYDKFNQLSYKIDPNGRKQTYEYDYFGRLVNIRDKDNNILKHNEYHYSLY